MRRCSVVAQWRRVVYQNLVIFGPGSLVHVMACRPLGTKPLPEPMLIYIQLSPWS